MQAVCVGGVCLTPRGTIFSSLAPVRLTLAQILIETGSGFWSASEDEDESYSRRQQQDEPKREHDDEESEDDGPQSSTTRLASSMGMLALGKANQMDSESDSEEDDFDAP